MLVFIELKFYWYYNQAMSENKMSASSAVSASGLGSAWGGKIGVIHSIYKPEVRGGAEVAVENMVLGLKNQGADVFVICVERQLPPPRPAFANASADCPPLPTGQAGSVRGGEIKVYRIRSFNLFNFLDINSQPAWLRFFWHLLDMFNLPQARCIYKVLNQEKPALVLTHNLKGLSYLTPLAIKILKIKNIHTVHDMQLIHPSGLLKESGKIGFLVKIYAGLNKILFKPVKLVVFPSQYIKSVYEKQGFFKKAEKIVLGNPIIISHSNMLTLPEPACPVGRRGRAATLSGADQGGGRGKFQILFLGQVEAYKGIFDLLEAVGGVKGDFILNIAGDGSVLTEAKIRAQEAFPDGAFGAQIRFWGRLNQEELQDKIWPQTDILVNPSRVGESFGLVVIEALANGVPVLVSAKGALPELVKEGETGFMVRDNKWREKIQWCVDNRQALKALRENCFQTAKIYQVENYLKRLLEFSQIDN